MVREGRWRPIPGGKKRIFGRNVSIIHRDSIAITTHKTTPLNKKYATLAAIHDASGHCDYPLSPWKGKPFKNPFSAGASEEDADECSACFHFLALQNDVVNLTDDDRVPIQRMLSVVAADAESNAKSKKGQGKGPGRPPGGTTKGDREIAMSWKALRENDPIATYEEHDKKHGHPKGTTGKVVDRHRHREKRCL